MSGRGNMNHSLTFFFYLVDSSSASLKRYIQSRHKDKCTLYVEGQVIQTGVTCNKIILYL